MTQSRTGRAGEIIEYLFDPRKDIELFGMYGAHNIGDEAMKIVGLSTLPSKRTVATVPTSRLPFIGRMIDTRVRPHLVFGGGTLIHGGGDNDENAWLDVAARFAHSGARVAFFGTGISFFEEQLAARTTSVHRWAKILAGAAYIGVRGPLSQRQAAILGSDAHIFGDAAFGLHRKGQAESARDARRIGFNFGECLGDQPAYEALNAELLRDLSKRFLCAIYVVRPGDRASTQRIITLAGVSADRYEIIEIFDDVMAYMDSVSHCHAFIGLKLHASGLALVTGVPSLLFGYEKKCRDFMLPIDLEHTLIDMSSDASTVGQQVEDMLSHPDRYRNDAAIGAIATRQRETINNYFGSEDSRKASPTTPE